MKSLRFKMYSSLIFGKLAIITGLCLFVSNSEKTTGRFVILMGLISAVIGAYLFFFLEKRKSIK